MIFEGNCENLVTVVFYIDAKTNSKAVKGTNQNVNQDSGINQISKHLMLNNVKILLLNLCLTFISSYEESKQGSVFSGLALLTWMFSVCFFNFFTKIL